jgi:hypothetical protein
MEIVNSLVNHPWQKDFLYLDPGSGSFILQALLAALLGGAYLVKVYWRKIKGWFSGTSDHANADSGEVKPDDEK